MSFKYNTEGHGDDILEHISFTAKPGQIIGIVGGTGCGKSSLVNLIPRLYDATQGQVLIDGVDVRKYDLTALREMIGVVLQKNVLFSGTIKENIRWGKKDATDEEIVAACQAAQAHDFVLAQPKGYDTDLSQGGLNLSGGQKQRLCIARAMIKHPKILILDDSTSAVDTQRRPKFGRASIKILRTPPCSLLPSGSAPCRLRTRFWYWTTAKSRGSVPMSSCWPTTRSTRRS